MTVENLEINVKTNAGNAASGLKSLSDALERVGNAGRSASSVGDTVANSVKKVRKEVEPLSDELQEAISGATKYEVLVNKAATAQMKMGKAFSAGDEERAWREREKSINATAAAARELEKQQAKIQPTATPISVEMQGVISSASQIDVLEAKLASLKVALQEAFDTGNTDKAFSIQGQILRVESQLDKARNAADKTGESIRNIGDEAKKATKHTNKLWSSIKRIAMYRLLRSVIKEITQAFSEGLKAAYAFSAGLTTEGNRFAAALDSMKSATNQMKGQLGSALAGLLTAIAPILEKIINLVVKVADVMSQFFAAFTGSTYLRAIRTQAEFADITAQGAKSANEWKNQLLGFDEINKLNEPSSGGGTGTNLLEGYAFEDAPISEGIMRFVEKVKTLFAGLKESLSPVIDTISKGLAWAWNNILVPLGEWTINEALPVAVEFLGAAFELLLSVLEPLWEPILKPFFEACGKIILTGLKELTDLLKKLTDLIKGNIGWDEFISGLNGVQVALLAIGGVLVLTGIAKVTTAIIGIPTAIKGALVGTKLGLATMATLLAAACTSILGNLKKLQDASEQYKTAQAAHTHETETALSLYERLYNKKGKEIADQWAKMVYQVDLTNADFDTAQKILSGKIEGYWADVPQNMWDGFRQGWDHYFGKNGAGVGQYVKDAASETADSFKDVLGIHSPSTVFEDIGINSVKGLWNGFNETWRAFMSDLRSKLVNMRSMLQQGLSFSVHVQGGQRSSSLSMYAAGGLPDTGELFIANERGPELVGSLNGHSAVANNGQIEAGIEEAAYRGFVRAISSGGNRGGDVVLNINGREFARATYKDYQAAARETGGSLINNFA